MKLISGFAVAALMAATVSSAAFAKDCGTRPPRLAIPDGKTASEDEMKATSNKIAVYIKAMNAVIVCETEDAKSMQEEAKSVSDEYKRQADIFVKTPAPAK
jgi:hypothetical protein